MLISIFIFLNILYVVVYKAFCPLSFSHASTVPTEAFTKQSIIMNQINILQDDLALTSQIENNKIKSLRPTVKNSIIQNSAIDQAKTINDTLMDTMTFGNSNGLLTE